MNWEICEEEWPDFRGRIYKNRPKNLGQMLRDTVKKYPDKVGFIYGSEKLTFAEFGKKVDRITSSLKRNNVKKGDRVSLLLGNSLMYPLCFFAITKLGAIAVTLNTRYKGEELAYEINDCESTAVIVEQDFWPNISPVRKDLKSVEKVVFVGENTPEGTVNIKELIERGDESLDDSFVKETDDAMILYTSGTTGKPKGAILSHRGLIATAMQVSQFADFQPEDRVTCVMPLFHVGGLVQIMLPHIFGGIPCVYVRAFKTKEFLEIMSSEKITKSPANVPNILWLMVNHPDIGNYDLSSYKATSLGASAITEEMIKRIKEKLPHLKIATGYGLTEASGVVSQTPFEDLERKLKSVGKALPLVDVGIMDDDGNMLPANTEGEIVVRGPGVIRGYWNNENATRATIVNGWLRTGDIGKIDDEGFIFILDRKKDMINRGGEKIFSLEVENVISKHPKVLEVAVVGAPDTMLGEVVKAVIVLRPGEVSNEEEIRVFCQKRLADYKVPKYVEFLDALPKNPAGKVVKGELKRAQQLSFEG
jgi:acyl-CoA synthetase (AMP-forming)/AMP-acid ligase II